MGHRSVGKLAGAFVALRECAGSAASRFGRSAPDFPPLPCKARCSMPRCLQRLTVTLVFAIAGWLVTVQPASRSSSPKRRSCGAGL